MPALGRCAWHPWSPSNRNRLDIEPVFLEYLRVLGEVDDDVAHADGGHADLNFLKPARLRSERRWLREHDRKQ
jgi:hypothetical protein